MIPFNRPSFMGKESENIQKVSTSSHLSGDGSFTKFCHHWLEENTHSQKALLTHSCTAALEMAAILADLQAGDEVIMPSYTFVSTANAVVLRGATPVFVDVRQDTLNLDEKLIETAITNKTKAIIVVHYAGVSCEMDTILAVAQKHNLLVIEDAAQGVMATYKGRALGAIGSLGCYSFHESKNIIAGEGGALLINDPKFAERAEIIREKGTNRSQFFRGQVDKYTWVDMGSSYLPSELTAAFLAAQLEKADEITRRRLDVWNQYHAAFADLEKQGMIRRPTVPPECQHNAHMYYLLLDSLAERTQFIDYMKQNGVSCVFHYVPLHSSPYGSKIGRTSGSLKWTESLSERLVRLPLWCGLSARELQQIIDLSRGFLTRKGLTSQKT